MKKPKTSTMVAAAAIAIGLSAAGAGVIHAASSTAQTNPVSSLVTAISQKFNLKQSDVQQVFDQQRQQMDTQRQQAEKDRLTQAVKDGKLTQDQADKISAKMIELQAQREANKNAFEGKTLAERQALIKTEMDSLKQWATDNKIPTEFLPLGGPKMGHRGGPGMGMDMMGRNQDGDGDAGDFQTITPTTTQKAQ